MKLHNLFAGWFRRAKPVRSPAPRNRRVKLALEHLEDRSLPSSYTAASVSELIADINAANLTAEADTITLAAGKTFTLNTVDNTAHGATGLPTIAATENLTILGNGDIIERSTVAGTPAFRLFDVAAGASLTLQNLTLQGGLAFGYGVWAQGGAVYNLGALNLQNVTVQNNTAQGVDGIDRSYFPSGGHAAGGGIYSAGMLTVAECIISNNAAIGGRGGDGGMNNAAFPPAPQPGGVGGNGFGGGLYAAGGTVTLHTTSVAGNTATGGSGGAGAKKAAKGATGQGVGGGIYIDVTALAGLDAFTIGHVTRNHASTSDDNIHGSYGVIL